MKTWSAIFNIFGILILCFMLLVYVKVSKVELQDFETLRLNYAVDYASEAAFLSTLNVEDIDNVSINPALALKTFDTIMCMSYDMAITNINLKTIEESIVTMVLVANDGYYTADMQEVDNLLTDSLKGNEYELVWSVKKPFMVIKEMDNGGQKDKYVFAVNINNHNASVFEGSGNFLGDFKDYTEKTNTASVEVSPMTFKDFILPSVSDKEVRTAMNKAISNDINYNIYMRNNALTTLDKTPCFCLSSTDSLTSIQSIKNPSMFVFVQGAEYTKCNKRLGATSVSEVKLIGIRKVIGFTMEENGFSTKYYCYEKQLPRKNGEFAEGISVQESFMNMRDAVLAGYKPHAEFLMKDAWD